MTATDIQPLLERVTEHGRLEAPFIENDTVAGHARIVCIDASVAVHVEPELEENGSYQPEALIAGVDRVLDVSQELWTEMLADTADEIASSLEDDGVMNAQGLAAALAPEAVVVFADVALIVLTAPLYLPATKVLVQVDADFEIEGIELHDDEDADVTEMSEADLLKLIDEIG